MQVISVDPAPKKGGTVFDGGFKDYQPRELVAYCQDLAKNGATLLCWDAPLTGPEDPDKGILDVSTYSQRLIDSFFARDETRYKAPKGISVLPYSGCPHWTISRASIGLPRVSRFDTPQEKLPFKLVHDAADIGATGNFVVETHPAVAIWLWCRKSRAEADILWIYKGVKRDSDLIAILWPILVHEWRKTSLADVIEVTDRVAVPKNDDQLDAITGWVLGKLLLHRHRSVTILGNASTGSFALPYDPELIDAFEKFKEKFNARRTEVG